MLVNPGRKNKIILSDYNYRQDISNRLLMADFSVFEVEVLDEVLAHSLQIPISELVEVLEVSCDQIKQALDKLVLTGLLTHNGETVVVDKEKRKYYEFQIQKFDDDFAPNLEFIFRGLKRVPIHVLPNWYSIPRSSDDISASIIEKYLSTPCAYRRHLLELESEDPVLQGIMNDVFKSEDFCVRSRDLRSKYDLSREEFEEYMLLLEFNLVCFISYRRVDDQWKEVVTPLHEWREYLRFQRDARPSSISQDAVEDCCMGENFLFIRDMSQVLEAAADQPIPFAVVSDPSALVETDLENWWKVPEVSTKSRLLHFQRVVIRLYRLGLLEQSGANLEPSSSASSWSKLSVQSKAVDFSRAPLFTEDFPGLPPELFSEKNIRAVEKSLRRVVNFGWITFDAFIKWMIDPVGSSKPVTLQRKGKRWHFALPIYQKPEREFIRKVIFDRMFELGLVSIGVYQDLPCFQLTAMGRVAIGEEIVTTCVEN